MTDSKKLYSNHHAIVMNNIQKKADLDEILVRKSIKNEHKTPCFTA